MSLKSLPLACLCQIGGGEDAKGHEAYETDWAQCFIENCKCSTSISNLEKRL